MTGATPVRTAARACKSTGRSCPVAKPPCRGRLAPAMAPGRGPCSRAVARNSPDGGAVADTAGHSVTSRSGCEHDAAEHFARVHPAVGVRGGVERHDVIHDGVDLSPDGGGELVRPDACQFRSGNGVEAQRAK